MTPDVFVRLVDHTALKPEATEGDIDRLCREAAEHGFFAVCVNSMWVSAAAQRLDRSGVGVCSVVGFPLGAVQANALATEVSQAVADGASEIDMVIPVGPLKSGDEARVIGALESVRRAAADSVVKVILETALLTDSEIVRGCELSVATGADFVKTSTGFNPAGGARPEVVRLMRATVGPDIGVKASGGLRTLADASAMVEAGASRLGMSAAVDILAEF